MIRRTSAPAAFPAERRELPAAEGFRPHLATGPRWRWRAGVLPLSFARGYSPRAWEAAYMAAVEYAFHHVPFYREQWAVAGRELSEPGATPAGRLEREADRLCPLSAPWDPTSEPSLWTGNPKTLWEALQLADVGWVRAPVLEVRRSLVDWSSLGVAGPYHRTLLPPAADTGGDDSRRASINASAIHVAAVAGRATIVGSPAELSEMAPELRALDGLNAVTLRFVRRCTLGEAQGSDQMSPCILHDPYLGHVGAQVPGCGRYHVNWRRYHCRNTDAGLGFTTLRSRRPLLANVVPCHPGFSDVTRCPEHGTPVLEL